MREASEQLRGRRKRRRLTFGRLVLLALIGAALALLLSEDLRKAVLDKMFGAEEEFEYTSTTSPAPETASTQSIRRNPLAAHAGASEQGCWLARAPRAARERK